MRLVWQKPRAIVFGEALGAAQLNATYEFVNSGATSKKSDENKALSVEWTYDPPEKTVLVMGAAHVLVATCKLCSKDDRRNYRLESDSVETSIEVSLYQPSLEWPTPAPVVYGTALSGVQLACRLAGQDAHIAGSFVYTVDSESDADGAVLSAGRHRITARFLPQKSDQYSISRMEVWLQVDLYRPKIVWANPHDILYGTRLGAEQLCAVLSAEDVHQNIRGDFRYVPAAGELLEAGAKQALRVFFHSSDPSWDTAQAEVEINVCKREVSLSWPTPKPIEYRTALSRVQLCCSAFASAAADDDATGAGAGVGVGVEAVAVAGTFYYDPDERGALLDVGPDQQLSVRFVPSDSRNYSEASSSVLLSVLPLQLRMLWRMANAELEFGETIGPEQLNAQLVGGKQGDAPGVFRYSVLEGDTAVEIEAGKTVLQASPKHQLQVDFFPADDTRFVPPPSVTAGLFVRPATVSFRQPAVSRCERASHSHTSNIHTNLY